MQIVRIPNDPNQPGGIWQPRPHQRALWTYLSRGGKRAIAIDHRRSGKDELGLHWTCVSAHQRVGNYWHMLPQAAQARKAIWDALDPHRNLRRIDVAFPHAVRENTRSADMWIQFKNGSTWQVIGSDNYNSIVGSPPVGIVFSEWALADPLAWAFLRPIVEENDGWAIFVTTPRGPNHAKRMYDEYRKDGSWYVGRHDATQTGLIDGNRLSQIKRDYIRDFGDIMGGSLFEQEYLCSFEAAIIGAVYGNELKEAREEGRITDVPYDKAYPVETWWDIGWSDPCAIWFVQRTKSGLVRAIDYYESRLQGLDHYAQILGQRGYVYSRHLAPHDAAKGELGSGRTLVEMAGELGLKFEVQPRTELEAGIAATRALIGNMVLDAKKCARGIDSLTNYRYKYDETTKALSRRPEHDWASHGADALRTGSGAKGPEHKRKYRRDLPRVAVI